MLNLNQLGTKLLAYVVVLGRQILDGAAWLDVNQPGWEGKVDLGKLELASSCRCVLGQIAPGERKTNGYIPLSSVLRAQVTLYDQDYEDLEISDIDGYTLMLVEGLKQGVELQNGYGFTADPAMSLGVAEFELWVDPRGFYENCAMTDYTQWNLLDEGWIALIKQRHDAGTLSG